MHLAILHAGWAIQGHMRDLVNGLAAQGHDLTLIATTRDDCGMVDLASLRGHVELVSSSRILSSLHRHARARLGSWVPDHAALSDPLIRARVTQVLRRLGPIDLLIGVEKAGLDLAASWGEREHIPFVYYSLELYLEDHPGLAGFGWQRRRECLCHARARGTIIQDPLRWDALRTANRIGDQPVFFLPIGVVNGQRLARTPHAAPFTVLSFGMQGKNRYTRELISRAARWPAGFTLWLHGPVFEPATRRLSVAALPANVRFTTRLLPERELPAMLEQADIGLALYRCDNANDRLTAYSSQRIAQYLQFSLPLVALRNPSYADLFSRFRCGEMIEDLDEIPTAARRILDAYPSYSAAAQEAFTAVYRLDRYWHELAAFLETCARPDDQRVS